MRAGRLDRVITIQRRVETQSASGEPQVSWETVSLRRRAQVSPIGGQERYSIEQYVASNQVEFRIRYSADVLGLTPRDRIVYPALPVDSPLTEPEKASVFDILFVNDIGRREGLRIVAASQPDARA